jgi:hypothetical protein
LLLGGFLFIRREVWRQVRHDHVHALTDGDIEAWRDAVEHRLFNEKHPTFTGETDHQMLGTLKHEIPSEMR